MTDKVKLYVVNNDCGEYLADPSFEIGNWDEDITSAILYKHKEHAEEGVNHYGGHVVELVEAPANVVVCEEEAEMLERLRTDENVSPAGAIRNYFWGSVEGQNVDNKPRWSRENEARLMRAYVNGWTVEKPKLWNVKVPHAKDVWYYKAWNSDLRTISDKELRSEFTEAEIEHYDLQDCEKVEVTDD